MRNIKLAESRSSTLFAVSSIQLPTVHMWDHSGSPELRIVAQNPKIRKAMTIWREKEKMLASIHIIYHKRNLIYKHLVEAVGEEDPEKILAHKGWETEINCTVPIMTNLRTADCQ